MIDFSKIKKSLRGACNVSETSRGLSFSRLPEWSYLQHAHNPNVAKMAERTSGVHFEIETAADRITLTYRSIRDSAPEFNWIAGPATVAITANDFEQSISHSNGDLRVWEGERVKEILEGEDSVAEFELPAVTSSRIVRIWLPQNCPVEVINLEANSPWSPVSTSDRRKWVHYGSSISHCEDASGPLGVWPVAASRVLDVEIYNLGLSGCANLDQFAARTIRDLPADLISLKVGINIVNGANHTLSTFISAVHGFLDTIREVHTNTPILLISPICCPAHEDNPGPSATDASGQIVGQNLSEHDWIGELTLKRIRSALTEIVRVRSVTDSNLYYMDGLELFNQDEAKTMPDGIHPDAAGYKTIAENFLARYPRDWFRLKTSNN